MSCGTYRLLSTLTRGTPGLHSAPPLDCGSYKNTQQQRSATLQCLTLGALTIPVLVSCFALQAKPQQTGKEAKQLHPLTPSSLKSLQHQPFTLIADFPSSNSRYQRHQLTRTSKLYKGSIMRSGTGDNSGARSWAPPTPIFVRHGQLQGDKFSRLSVSLFVSLALCLLYIYNDACFVFVCVLFFSLSLSLSLAFGR